MSISLSTSEFTVRPDSGQAEGVALRARHHEQTTGPAGSIYVTDGSISIPHAMPDNPNASLDPSAFFQIHDKNSPAMQTISVNFSEGQIQIQTLRIAKSLETCRMLKVNN